MSMRDVRSWSVATVTAVSRPWLWALMVTVPSPPLSVIECASWETTSSGIRCVRYSAARRTASAPPAAVSLWYEPICVLGCTGTNAPARPAPTVGYHAPARRANCPRPDLPEGPRPRIFRLRSPNSRIAAAMSELSENIRKLQPSATIAVASKAKELKAKGRDIVDLSAGEPDFPTPGFIARAGQAAIEVGRTRYTPAPGTPELRAAVARSLAERHGREVDPAGVVVSAGAKQALFNTLFALVGPGDKVLIPVPYWTSYPEMVTLARAQPVPVQGPEERGYRIGPEELDRAWSPEARALLLNSPSNPSGAVYPAAELEAILAWAADRGVWVISDEIYARLCYLDHPAPGIYDFPDRLLGRAVLIDGASKAFAMTGWRIGWSVCEPRLASTLSALQSHTTSNAATPSQHAALAALQATGADADELEAMAAAFRSRRDLVLELLEAHLPGAGRVEPEGAFYLFFRVDQWYDDARPDSVALCTWLIEHAGVALVPGSAFGDDRYVRLSFAASPDELREGFERLGRALGS